MIHTTIPSRPRTEITTYTIQKGDTIFGIAEMFGLKPETILWGNYLHPVGRPAQYQSRRGAEYHAGGWHLSPLVGR